MLSAFGTGEVPISISGDCHADGPLVHTVRGVGLATQAICEARVGEVLGVRGPFGRPWPVGELVGADVLVVCGGIGLAPLRPAILALLARREQYGRIVLLYGGRSPSSCSSAPSYSSGRSAASRSLSRSTARVPSGSATWGSCRGWYAAPVSTRRAPSHWCVDRR